MRFDHAYSIISTKLCIVARVDNKIVSIIIYSSPLERTLQTRFVSFALVIRICGDMASIKMMHGALIAADGAG